MPPFFCAVRMRTARMADTTTTEQLFQTDSYRREFRGHVLQQIGVVPATG